MSEPARPASQLLNIRKYPNRRYYDTTRSRHLTLEEIRSLIRDGYDIKVTDSKTGGDITAQVLTQIILELETGKIDSFPVALLLRMIRSNDQLVRDFVETYFNQAFRAYLEYQKQMEERLRQMQGAGGVFNPLGAWAQAAMAPFAPPFGIKPPEGASAPPTTEGSSADPTELRQAVTELQQQLTALHAKLKKARPRRR